MKGTWSTLRLAVPLALLLAAAMPGAPAHAGDDGWVPWDTSTDPDGTVVTIFYNQYDKSFFRFVYVTTDGTVFEHTIEVKGGGDPSPDDATGRGTEPLNVAGLIASGKITYKVRANVEDSKLGEWIDRDGGGGQPHWNPGDQDTGTGPGGPPKSDTGIGLTPKELAERVRQINVAARSMDIIGRGMADGLEGGNEGPQGVPTNKGGGSGKSNNNGQRPYTDNQNKTIGKTEKLGPKPELINPPPKSKLMGAGLLDGGGGLSSSGPAGVGGAAGGTGGAQLGGARIR